VLQVGNFNSSRRDDESWPRATRHARFAGRHKIRYAGGKLNRKWKVVKVGHSSRVRARAIQAVDEVIIAGMRSGEYGERAPGECVSLLLPSPSRVFFLCDSANLSSLAAKEKRARTRLIASNERERKQSVVQRSIENL